MDLIKKVFNLPKTHFGSSPKGKNNYLVVEKILKLSDINLDSFSTIHVAGTNGKGSVATKIATVFSKSDYKVGLFTSPHLIDPLERVSIASLNRYENISEKRFSVIAQSLFTAFEKCSEQPSFFDFLTALALVYFVEEKVDVAIVECGIGGRFDSTNVVNPILSIITSISLDHQDLLGQGVESIAWHKAGIIKKNHTILGPKAVLKPILDEVKLKKATCEIVDGIFDDYEKENQAIAKKAISYLEQTFVIKKEVIDESLLRVQQGRFQIFALSKTLWILDVAHNLSAVKKLFDKFQLEYPGVSPIVLFSASRDKDFDSMFQVVKKYARVLFLPFLEDPRALDPLCLSSDKKDVFDDFDQAFKAAKNEGEEKSLPIVVCGSFLIVRKALSKLELDLLVDKKDL